jgi:hypothetical protein
MLSYDARIRQGGLRIAYPILRGYGYAMDTYPGRTTKIGYVLSWIRVSGTCGPIWIRPMKQNGRRTAFPRPPRTLVSCTYVVERRVASYSRSRLSRSRTSTSTRDWWRRRRSTNAAAIGGRGGQAASRAGDALLDTSPSGDQHDNISCMLPPLAK